MHDDAAGTAVWKGGTRVVTSHAAGHQVMTDMPVELGGSGDQVSPGWMVRAGLASCLATTIAFLAAQDGIALDKLEVRAFSRSDLRGMMGIPQPDGSAVSPGMQELTVEVTIHAASVSPERLAGLVQAGQALAPISAAMMRATPIELRVLHEAP